MPLGIDSWLSPAPPDVTDVRAVVVVRGFRIVVEIRFYFFLPDPKVGCQPAVAPFWLGAAAIVLTFSFFGFLDSRLPFFSPLATLFSTG